jgi:hypothetical protein
MERYICLGRSGKDGIFLKRKRPLSLCARMLVEVDVKEEQRDDFYSWRQGKAVRPRRSDQGRTTGGISAFLDYSRRSILLTRPSLAFSVLVSASIALPPLLSELTQAMKRNLLLKRNVWTRKT